MARTCSCGSPRLTDQGGDDRGTDRFQDQWQLVPLLLRQRWDRAQRRQQRPDGHGTVNRDGVPGPLVDRLVRTPEIGDCLRQQLPLPQRGKDLMEQHQGEEHLEPGQQRRSRPRGLANDRSPQDMVRLEEVQHVHDAQYFGEGSTPGNRRRGAPFARSPPDTRLGRWSRRGPG